MPSQTFGNRHKLILIFFMIIVNFLFIQFELYLPIQKIEIESFFQDISQTRLYINDNGNKKLFSMHTYSNSVRKAVLENPYPDIPNLSASEKRKPLYIEYKTAHKPLFLRHIRLYQSPVLPPVEIGAAQYFKYIRNEKTNTAEKYRIETTDEDKVVEILLPLTQIYRSQHFLLTLLMMLIIFHREAFDALSHLFHKIFSVTEFLQKKWLWTFSAAGILLFILILPFQIPFRSLTVRNSSFHPLNVQAEIKGNPNTEIPMNYYLNHNHQSIYSVFKDYSGYFPEQLTLSHPSAENMPKIFLQSAELHSVIPFISIDLLKNPHNLRFSGNLSNIRYHQPSQNWELVKKDPEKPIIFYIVFYRSRIIKITVAFLLLLTIFLIELRVKYFQHIKHHILNYFQKNHENMLILSGISILLIILAGWVFLSDGHHGEIRLRWQNDSVQYRNDRQPALLRLLQIETNSQSNIIATEMMKNTICQLYPLQDKKQNWLYSFEDPLQYYTGFEIQLPFQKPPERLSFVSDLYYNHHLKESNWLQINTNEFYAESSELIFHYLVQSNSGILIVSNQGGNP